MIKSMTGYGIVQGKLAKRRVVLETKSVNHKFCEVNLRLSPRYSIFEGKISEAAKSFFSRGRIDILVKEEHANNRSEIARIDTKKIRAYHDTIKKVAKDLKITADIDFATLLNLPQVIVTDEEEDLDSLWEELEVLLRKSFVALEKMRQKEGLGIANFFESALKDLSQHVDVIEKMIPNNVVEHQRQLSERISKLTSGIDLDAQRLAQEIAYFVDRSDVSEELQRLKHHIEHFYEILNEAAPLGRKLDFLLQEMNRETNTLSAKAQSAIISQKVVLCKHLLEQLREQVQNVE